MILCILGYFGTIPFVVEFQLGPVMFFRYHEQEYSTLLHQNHFELLQIRLNSVRWSHLHCFDGRRNHCPMMIQPKNLQNIAIREKREFQYKVFRGEYKVFFSDKLNWCNV